MYEHALVVGKFAPLHRGHQLVLDRAQSSARRLTIVLWSNPDFETMPNGLRAEWIRQLYPESTVVVGTGGPPNDAPDVVSRDYTAGLLRDNGLEPDAVFSSESYGPGFASHLGIAHVLVDQPRMTVPVSGSLIRADVHAHQHDLDPLVYGTFVERVVFMGAESTGKTTLTERMATEFDTAFVSEYGRDHYAERNGVLGLEDYVTIAERHRQLEDEATLRANRYLFVDTNAITTMFFSRYNRESLPALRSLAEECADRYQQVFLCDDDIPFEQDGWRDNVVWRRRMQGMVMHDLAVRGIQYHVVSGSLDQRVAEVKRVLRLDAFRSSHLA